MQKYSVVTFGCQMNSHDSERISDLLEDTGYEATDDVEEADLVVLNTCSVREKAVQKLRSEVGRMAVLKRRRPNMVLAVAGCVAQQEGEKLLRSMRSVDLIFGPDIIPELPALLSQLEQGGPALVRTEFDLEEPSFLMARPRDGRGPTAFVTTMKGCDERCSYCIVPTTRGPERYRGSSEVLEEIRRLVDSGVKEVTLLGQTVDSYIDPESRLAPAPHAGEERARHARGKLSREDETEFPALLYAIASEVPELKRLRYTSPHPRHLTPSLIVAHRELPVLVRHVHMPVQSGSDRVLKRMLRRYSIAEYLERTGQLKEAVPGLTLSTDIIVGFPGETREDFEKTLDVMRAASFTGVYGFKYSERPFTPALKMDNDVSEEEKSERLTELFDLADDIRNAHLASLVGTDQRLLVEGFSRGGGYTGRTERNEIVHFGCSDDPVGQLVDVKIERAFKHSLAAVLLDNIRARPLGGQDQATSKRSLNVVS